MNSTKCPYCGKTVSYPVAYSIERSGEYYCKKCKKESNVYIKKTIWLLFFAMLILAVLALLFFLFMTDRENLLFLIVVAVPFIIFYLFSPLFVRLRPKKKFQDSLYDTEMVDTPIADPDPTMAQSAKVVPAFVDDIVLGDDEYRPAIDSSVFNAIKEERKVVAETNGGTKSFDRFENISSASDIGSTRPVKNLKSITADDTDEPADTAVDESYDLTNFE